MEGEACLQDILHISQKPHRSGSPVKEPPQGPLHGIPRREMPHHYSPPSFIYQSPRYTSPPTYQVPLGWKGDPMERDACIWRLS